MSAEYGLCLKCYDVIDPMHYKFGDLNLCPRMSCNYEIILVDENMIPIITALNKKGYKTSACCSSHQWDSDMGILICMLHFNQVSIYQSKSQKGLYLKVR